MKLLIIICTLIFSFNSYLWAQNLESYDEKSTEIIRALEALSETESGLTISHFNHPSYNEVSFLYDNAVVALAFYYGGKEAKARELMDYYHDIIQEAKLNIEKNKDYNGIYGAAKLLSFGEDSNIGLVNSLDVNVKEIPGAGRLEFHVTPGPTSFLIFAFLHIDPDKYLDSVLDLGELLLAMQDSEGGIVDGDRSRNRIHSEPHADAYAAFKMLYEETKDEKWNLAAEKAQVWLREKVYESDENIVWQGFWEGKLNKVLAEDAFSWSIISGIMDFISAEKLYDLNKKLLELFLVQIELELPNEDKRKLFLVDFTDPSLPETVAVRKGLHPMGTVEWSAGAIMALQKSATRLYRDGSIRESKELKAIAELMLKDSFNAFYEIPYFEGLLTFYASGQGIEVGPFGAIKESNEEGWLTPYYNLSGQNWLQGGCAIGSWILFPYWGINPFERTDSYKIIYDQIRVKESDFENALTWMKKVSVEKSFTEKTQIELQAKHTIIVEPRDFNKKMWNAFNRAEKIDDDQIRTEYYHEMKKWANKVLTDEDWLKLAKEQSQAKKAKYGSLIPYKWGEVSDDNKGEKHTQIMAYPILNELGAAYWGLIVSSYELNELEELCEYFKEMVDVTLMHQIPQVRVYKSGETLIEGYWNAIAQFCKPIYPTQRDYAIYQILKEKLGQEYLDEVYSQL